MMNALIVNAFTKICSQNSPFYFTYKILKARVESSFDDLVQLQGIGRDGAAAAGAHGCFLESQLVVGEEFAWHEGRNQLGKALLKTTLSK